MLTKRGESTLQSSMLLSRGIQGNIMEYCTGNLLYDHRDEPRKGADTWCNIADSMHCRGFAQSQGRNNKIILLEK